MCDKEERTILFSRSDSIFSNWEKNLCQIKNKWRELQKRKLDFSNESWVIPGQVQMWFRSRPKTRSPLRATLEIMLVFRQLGKIIRYFPDRIMNNENNPFGSSLNSRTSRGSFMAQRNHPFKSKTVSWPSYDLQNPPRSSLRGNFQGSLRRSIRGLKINENQQIRREEGAEKVIHPTPPLPPRSPTWKETLESVFEAPMDLKRAELQHQLQGKYQLSYCNSKNFDPIKTNKQKIRVKKDAVYKFFSLWSQCQCYWQCGLQIFLIAVSNWLCQIVYIQPYYTV